jgi:SAM-dependent methyltransferase
VLNRLLAHPLTRDLHIDSPETTILRREIIRGKPFLRHIYEDWYRAIAAAIPGPPEVEGPVVELDSGAGFLEEFIPGLITTDVLPVPGMKLLVDAHHLPFRDGALRAIVMTNVFHHFHDPKRFLEEAGRCVRAGGAIVMVEPWFTWWSNLIYTRFHHEPFDRHAREWMLAPTGPLSSANDALPWIMLGRDRARFERELPFWSIDRIELMMPLRYLVSGGIAVRTLMPRWSYGAWRLLEEGPLRPFRRQLAMFALIRLVRQ